MKHVMTYISFITSLEGFRGFIMGMTHKSTPFYLQTCGDWNAEIIICDHHKKKLIVFGELMSSLLGRFYNKFKQFMNTLITRSRNLKSYILRFYLKGWNTTPFGHASCLKDGFFCTQFGHFVVV
jgi:hypothetical protein